MKIVDSLKSGVFWHGIFDVEFRRKFKFSSVLFEENLLLSDWFEWNSRLTN